MTEQLFDYFPLFLHVLISLIKCACLLSCFSHVQLFWTPWTVACQAPLCMGILQTGILEWVAMLSSRGSANPGIESLSFMSSLWQAGSVPLVPPGENLMKLTLWQKFFLQTKGRLRTWGVEQGPQSSALFQARILH